MTWVAVLAGLLVAHAVGDYLLQTDWQALHKARGLGGDPVARRALGAHVLVYTVACVPVLVWVADDRGPGRAVAVAALIALPHLVIDDGRIVRGWIARVKGSARPDPSLVRAVDQAFHVLALWVAAVVAAA